MPNKKEGDLYKLLLIHGREFPIRYGYYSADERDCWELTPIFPDFLKEPMYTDEGFPFVTADQDTCPHFKPKQYVSGENWCNDCVHFSLKEELIGICICKRKQISQKRNI